MQDITDLLDSYRECARSMWNNFLRADADFQRIDVFSIICERLFQELVLRPIGRRQHRKAAPDEPYPFLHVVPVADSVPIMINRPSEDGNKYWDEPIDRVSRVGAKLLFIDYFDWDQMGYLDFQYYRVNINRLDSHPKLSGRQALMDVHAAKVYFQADDVPRI